MKKKLRDAKSPLPKFESDEAAAEYFDRHSVASVWNQLPVAKRGKLSPALRKKIRDRHARTKSPISSRLEPEQIAARETHRSGQVAYETQPRMGIAEGVRRERKRA